MNLERELSSSGEKTALAILNCESCLTGIGSVTQNPTQTRTFSEKSETRSDVNSEKQQHPTIYPPNNSIRTPINGQQFRNIESILQQQHQQQQLLLLHSQLALGAGMNLPPPPPQIHPTIAGGNMNM